MLLHCMLAVVANIFAMNALVYWYNIPTIYDKNIGWFIPFFFSKAGCLNFAIYNFFIDHYSADTESKVGTWNMTLKGKFTLKEQRDGAPPLLLQCELSLKFKFYFTLFATRTSQSQNISLMCSWLLSKKYILFLSYQIARR